MSKYLLPKQVEKCVASLAKLYGQNGDLLSQKILVNANISIHEEWSYDNWNGGTYGHALTLLIPEEIFLEAAAKKNEIEKNIQSQINTFHNVKNEFFDEVLLEMELNEDIDWRKGTGLLLTHRKTIPSSKSQERIWNKEQFKLFLSHKAEFKKDVYKLKEDLLEFGISAFVAHADIHPTREWQEEIENALSTMDTLAALLTPNFSESNWTDQEIGFALGAGIPIIPIRLGKDPYGFIGKIQGVSSTWETAVETILPVLIKHPKMKVAYINTVKSCTNFDHANRLSLVLPYIDSLSAEDANNLVDAYNKNTQVRSSYGFNGAKPFEYGKGLPFYISTLTKNRFILDPQTAYLKVK